MHKECKGRPWLSDKPDYGKKDQKKMIVSKKDAKKDKKRAYLET